MRLIGIFVVISHVIRNWVGLFGIGCYHVLGSCEVCLLVVFGVLLWCCLRGVGGFLILFVTVW